MSHNLPEPVLCPHDAECLQRYLRRHKPVIVEGGPGIGKSLAADYYGRRVYREFWKADHAHGGDNREADAWCEPLKIDITEDTEIRHLLGEIDLIAYFAHIQSGSPERKTPEDFFILGPVAKAIIEGRLLIVEELDRAGRETLFPVFFDAIEYRRTYVPELRKTIRAGDNHFNIVITVNRFTDIGTVSLPKALLRRNRCLRLYDPSLELGVNRWQAVQHETRIVMANVSRLLDESGLSRRKAEELVRSVMERVVFPLRAAGELNEPPTPAETAMWFRDMLECEGNELLADDASADARLAICMKYRGAIVKSSADEGRFAAALTDHFKEARR
jgi:MoxR-like ATPase